MSVPVFTYQARLNLAPVQEKVLEAFAELFGRVERSLFAALQTGKSITDIKREFLGRFGITARQFNAIAAGLKGKIASVKERRPGLIMETKERIRKAKKVVGKLEKRSPGSEKLHQKKRRLHLLEQRLEAMQADQENGIVRICFGSRKLFRAQFALEENGYQDIAEWRADWKNRRTGQLFLLGSKDETAGNQSCQAVLEEDGSLKLCLRLPDALGMPGKRLTIQSVRFAYGHEAILAALAASQRISAKTKAGMQIRKRDGCAISYRFLRDEKGWRVFASIEAQPVPETTRREAGAFGIDVNIDHLAVAEIDRFGNLVRSRRIDMNLYGKTTEQAKALIGDAAVSIAGLATKAGKPVVIEKLDLFGKRAELEAVDPARARKISSFACSKVTSMLKAACFRAGVEVIEVNPAYTSVIGAVNHARRSGVSVHQGAALAVARRGLGLSERPAVRQGSVPVRRGGHVTFALPVRNRAKHVWSYWAGVRRSLKAALAAHARSGEMKRSPASLSPDGLSDVSPTSCATRALTARSRHANRRQHCSAGVFGIHHFPLREETDVC